MGEKDEEGRQVAGVRMGDTESERERGRVSWEEKTFLLRFVFIVPFKKPGHDV